MDNHTSADICMATQLSHNPAVTESDKRAQRDSFPRKWCKHASLTPVSDSHTRRFVEIRAPSGSVEHSESEGKDDHTGVMFEMVSFPRGCELQLR